MIQGQDNPPAPEIDDGLLMARIVDRDENALRLLYNRHAAALLALCLRIVGDRTEAEQILLDVFWETWDRASRYDAARSAPLTYLTLLARSRSLDARRRRKSTVSTEAHRDGDGSSGMASEPSGDPAQSAPLSHLLADERAKSLREALMSLDDGERSLIEACFFDGCTHVELATRLRQPLGTVKTRIRRGLARLRTRLRGSFDEPLAAPRSTVADQSDVQ